MNMTLSVPLSIKDFIQNYQKNIVIDVRSPLEYQKGHIPSAYNLPLFTDEERAEVGTLYKQKGHQDAYERGLEIVGPKLAFFVKEAKKLQELNPEKEIFLYCWRGGMRSQSMAWLFKNAKFNCHVLKGGYKNFRAFIRQDLATYSNLILLGGMTGVGKTEILHELKKMQEQVVDLEQIARHQGSAFGSLGKEEQPSNEHFENLLYHEFSKFSKEKPIYLEDESRTIGKVTLPDFLFNNMKKSPLFLIDCPLKLRLERLVNDYGSFSFFQLEICLKKILKKLGGQNHSQALTHLRNKELEKTASIILQYYDKTYSYGLAKKEALIKHRFNFTSSNSYLNSLRILHFIKNSPELPKNY